MSDLPNVEKKLHRPGILEGETYQLIGFDLVLAVGDHIRAITHFQRYPISFP